MTVASDAERDGATPLEGVDIGLFGWVRRVTHTHPLAIDAALATTLLAASTLWLVASPFAGIGPGVLQALLVATIAFRRVHPPGVFCVTAAIALVQWLLGYQLIGDVALLVALYTVAVHEVRHRSVLAAAVLECGAVMAAFRWRPADTVPRSLAFLTATVVAAWCGGLTVASGSKYLAFLDERTRRLEIERDQQAVIATNAERTRIARELHDIVSHSLSVVITLADAAALVGRVDPAGGAEAMAEVSEVGRRALSDMRVMLGALRGDGHPDELAPQPDVAQLAALAERVEGTGLLVDLAFAGTPFPLGAALELTIYRIVQEALTNTLRHASAAHVGITIGYEAPLVTVEVIDDGTGSPSVEIAGQGTSGHGLDGMRERAALHGGAVVAGPLPGGGWSVVATLRSEHPSAVAAPALRPPAISTRAVTT